MRRLSLVVRNTALSLIVVAFAGCGGGGGGGSGAAAPVAAPPPPSQGAMPSQGPIPPAMSLSGPSVVPGGTPARFEGAGLSAGTAVTLVIRQPDGSESSFSTIVGADGRVSPSVTPGGAGVHSVRLLDATGQEVAASNFVAM